MGHRSLALLATLAALPAEAAPPPFRVPDETRQLLLVTTDGWDGSRGQLHRWRRTGDGGWRPDGQPLDVVIGQGMAWGQGVFPGPKQRAPLAASLGGKVKTEGDKRSPAGLFRLLEATGFSSAPPLATRIRYREATPRLRCVDDPRSPQYGRLVDAPATGAPPWSSAEEMRDAAGLYKWAIVVEHNRDPVTPGAGSCIFLHAWAGPDRPMVGCTAMPAEQVASLLTWLDPQAQPLLAQMPLPVYRRVAAAWGLPLVAGGSGVKAVVPRK